MTQGMRWLGPSGSPIRFPDPATALSWPNGLLAAGGDLSPERLLAAYRLGIFPWYEAGQPILWWSPDPRAVIFPEELHVARRLRRFLGRAPLETSFDLDFAGVLAGCARTDRPGAGTWITGEMMFAYQRLHALGHAHSVEIWGEEGLVGGLYGVAVGAVFFAESMFSRTSNASKAAMVVLIGHLRRWGFQLVDCQLPSAHLGRMGAREIPRRAFLDLVISGAADEHPEGCPWPPGRRPLSEATAPPKSPGFGLKTHFD